MNMTTWFSELLKKRVKKALPFLSSPAAGLLGVTVRELIESSELQAEGMKAVADRVDLPASFSLMDLSVEAEAFGSTILVTEHEVPTVVGRIIDSAEDAKMLKVPDVGVARTGLYIEALEKAVSLIDDRPVFAGMSGPYTLAALLQGVSKAKNLCYENPDMLRAVLEKCTAFLTAYARAFKNVGAAGIVIAEPLAGMLSPALNRTFSVPYLAQIIRGVQSDSFAVIYHNCGDHILEMISDIMSIGASAYHFGNAVDMREVLKLMPSDNVVMGNIDPWALLLNGTPEAVREAVTVLLCDLKAYPNFVLSTGCDIPSETSWDNIEAFFAAAKEFAGQ